MTNIVCGHSESIEMLSCKDWR